jgi:hypothetical protein
VTSGGEERKGGGARVWTAALVVLGACQHAATTAAAPPSNDGGVETPGPAPVAPRDAVVEDLWTQAADGEMADLARLHDREGESGLVERASVAAYRMTALAALGCGVDFTALPFLADVAASGTDAEAEAALASAASLAAVPRRTRDPEDALELRQGCETLLALARRVEVPRLRRARAVSTLRMLESTGCLHGEALPSDLDAK